MDKGFLSGRVVIEVAHPFTEYAGLVLAGLGATVYLVEPPGGAWTRSRKPLAAQGSEDRRSIPFLARNTGKRSVVIDPESEGDRDLLTRLAGCADVIIDGPETPFGALVDAVETTSRIRMTDPQGLGIGPIVGFAGSGGLSSSGWPHQPPCNAPSWLAQDGAGIYIAAFAATAIREQAQGREPLRWDVAYRDAALAAITPWTRPLHSYGMVVAGQGADSQRLGAGPYPIIPCKDGYIRFLTATPRQWDALQELLGRPEALSGEEWRDYQFRAQNFDVTRDIAGEILADRTQDEVFKTGQSLGLTITPVFDIPRFLEDEHINHREFFQELDDPDHGEVRVPRQPFRTEEGSPGKLLYPAPALDDGRKDAEALAVGPPPARTGAAPVAKRGQLPLEGIRVLNCGVGAVVPEAASMLAMLGADIIKVESRKHVDFLRQVGLLGAGDHNSCPTFNQLNLNCRSIAVDMGTEEGRKVVQDLVPHCDIVMENLRGPVMHKWGLDYASVRKLRPDVIYLSSQGLGDGPYGGFQTYGPNLQTFSAVTSQWAHPDDPFPVGSTLNHPDHVAGKQAVSVLLAALMRRDETGEGAYLDCAQFEVASAMIADRFVQEQLLPGSTAQHLGNASPDFAPHGCYPCAGEDRWCTFAVEDDAQWQRLAGLIGDGWVQDERFATMEGRLANREELDAKLAEWTRQFEPVELEGKLRAAGVPASRVAIGEDFANDRDAHGSLFRCVPHPTAGNRWHIGLPVADSEGGRLPVRRSPLLGEHDATVLFDLLGLPDTKVSALASSDAIGY